ncbi:unnamed protein product [Acanthoscelides obtectus]|uniref:Uncharacterized protein n=1 Tax=Acanthoscelides obtectus TaxID=200917 RepID=A0A9P0PJ28_ACAOB|nr:unnamed protein product [Acanthoscelides obtectus]CAK1633722.1 hypothetical protein AOBTE_LOCUS8343 [Acanthoscelides obtectus]
MEQIGDNQAYWSGYDSDIDKEYIPPKKTRIKIRGKLYEVEADKTLDTKTDECSRKLDCHKFAKPKENLNNYARF